MLLLLSLVIQVGSTSYELEEGSRIYVGEPGYYSVRLSGSTIAALWLSRGEYEVKIFEEELPNDYMGVTVLLSTGEYKVEDHSFELRVPYREGYYALKLKVRTPSCNITLKHWPHENSVDPLLNYILERIVEKEYSADGSCIVSVDTTRTLPPYFLVTLNSWVSITLTGPGFELALVYGVVESPQAGGGADSKPPSVPGIPVSPTLIDGSKLPSQGGLVSGDFNYFKIIGLLLILVVAAVSEYGLRRLKVGP
ncbi:MAG: hypothetical protein P3X22_002500 [Thermoprotei archaeon]|nr:hypothetical protein [Thermoprotei archaeon]